MTEEFFECGAPHDHPPTPYCCTLMYDSKCMMEVIAEIKADAMADQEEGEELHGYDYLDL
jgi:hypothetical protein